MENVYKYCEYCNRGIKNQNNWIRHTKTKKHLKNVEKGCKSPEKSSIGPVLVQKSPVLVQKKMYSCADCEKTYTNKSSYYYHRNHCKVKQSNKEKDEIIEELRKQLTEKNGNITNNTTNNNNTQNITNNDNKTINHINIKIEGREDFKNILDSNMYFRLGGIGGTEILQLYLTETFINKAENRSIKYTNTRSNKCKIHMGEDRWGVDKIDNVINKRIQTSPMHLNKMMIDYLKTLDEEARKAEEPNRQMIYDKIYRITRMVYEKDRPHLLNEANLTPKEKQDYKDMFEHHKDTLYNISI